ncbi:MAG: helix-turn-helix domain-containing protein [Bacilli bacterium]|nr:helix-turn-helix domain-containing protein [Bacilli bacterium]MDD4077360.1 helix-turn-helix transcriptional regulator [Bacilli bacterium]MDD4388487.1 helix-turn-helix transcriptional regulator [Bacilli bacterium]
MRIGNKIASRRKELGMTQQELADKLFISVKTVSKWETNRGNPEMNILPQLAKALDINISDLFDESEMQEEQILTKEKRYPNIINACIGFGVACLGLLFYILPFMYVKTDLSNTLPWYSPIGGNIPITLTFSGYKVLFTMSSNKPLGILFLLCVWISFIAIIVHIGLGIIEFAELKAELYSVKEKALYVLSIVETAAISLALIISLISSVGIGSGLIMMILLYGVILGYRIYEKKKLIN